MAFVHGKKSRVYVDGIDLTSYINSAQGSGTTDMAPADALGDEFKSVLPGLGDGNYTLAGYFDNDPTGVDSLMNSLARATVDPIATIMRDDAIDAKGESAQTVATSYSRTSPVGGVVAIAANLKADGEYDRVTTAFAKGTLTGTGGTTASQTPSGAGVHAYAHIFQVLGGTPVIVLEHSVSGSTSWGALATFAGATAAGAEQVNTSGTVRAFKRVTVTGGSAVCWVGWSPL